MAHPDRNTYDPSYDDSLMFDTVDEQDEPRGRPLLILLGMIVLAAFASVIWVAYNQGLRHASSGALPVLANDPGPFRVRPETVATAPAAGQDKLIYDKLQPDYARPGEAERILPPSEEPQPIAPSAPPPAASAVDPALMSGPALQPAPSLEVAPPPPALTAPTDLTGEGGPLRSPVPQVAPAFTATETFAAAPSVPATVPEGTPDLTIETLRPAGAPPAAAQPRTTLPSQSAAASPVDPLTAVGSDQALIESSLPAAAPPMSAPPMSAPPMSAPSMVAALPPTAPPVESAPATIAAAPPQSIIAAIPAPAPAAPTREIMSATAPQPTVAIEQPKPVLPKPKPPKPVTAVEPKPAASGDDVLDQPYSGPATGVPAALAIPQAPAAQAVEPQVSAPTPAETAALAPETASLPAATPAATAEPERPATAGGRSFAVQLGSFTSDADAAASWARIKSAHAGILGGAQPDILQVDLGAKGTRHRLRVGNFGDRSEAGNICARLKASGQDCVVAAR